MKRCIETASCAVYEIECWGQPWADTTYPCVVITREGERRCLSHGLFKERFRLL